MLCSSVQNLGIRHLLVQGPKSRIWTPSLRSTKTQHPFQHLALARHRLLPSPASNRSAEGWFFLIATSIQPKDDRKSTPAASLRRNDGPGVVCMYINLTLMHRWKECTRDTCLFLPLLRCAFSSCCRGDRAADDRKESLIIIISRAILLLRPQSFSAIYLHFKFFSGLLAFCSVCLHF